LLKNGNNFKLPLISVVSDSTAEKENILIAKVFKIVHVYIKAKPN